MTIKGSVFDNIPPFIEKTDHSKQGETFEMSRLSEKTRLSSDLLKTIKLILSISGRGKPAFSHRSFLLHEITNYCTIVRYFPDPNPCLLSPRFPSAFSSPSDQISKDPSTDGSQ
jgi:hypothetical protein